jgi:hypothetical protein
MEKFRIKKAISKSDSQKSDMFNEYPTIINKKVVDKIKIGR